MRRFLAGLLAALMVLSLCACGAADAPGKTDGQTAAVSWDELVFDRTMPLRYAEQFSVEYAGDSYKRITINNDRVYLLVAEGAGGSATNYILAGTIVGFAFSSVQTIFLTLSLDNIQNTMWWLYGSFANVTWENAWLVFVPAMLLSAVSYTHLRAHET